MSKVGTEWDYYLQAFRLHQGLSRGGNGETQTLLRQAMAKALENGRDLPRAYGLMSFTILNAWLSDWIDGDRAAQMLGDAIADVQAATEARGLAPDARDALQAVDSGGSIDTIAQAVILAYAQIAAALDGEDFENVWSLATAYLYNREFAEAFQGYDAARGLAEAQEAPSVSLGSLAVDHADILYFAGAPDLSDADEDYRQAIEQAIAMAEAAIANNPTDPKRHRWNWTLGWAYCELAGFVDPAYNYARAVEILQRLRTPHDLIVKNLIVSLAGSGDMASARQLAHRFMVENPSYTLAVEDRWPYRNPVQSDRWKWHLRSAGLPDPGGAQAP